MNLHRLCLPALGAGATVWAMALLLAAPPAWPAGADALRARYESVRPALRTNGLQHPLVISSEQSGDNLSGKVSAVLDHPFTTVREALREPAQWCELMTLPFNNKYCRAQAGPQGAVLLMRIGRRYDQPAQEAYPLAFSFEAGATSDSYFERHLEAAQGPLGTSDYRIEVSAIALEGGRRTFLALDYAYRFGLASRMAMGLYLGTAGAHRVGFTVTGRGPDGQPEYIGGVRGAIERTAMRYYLAVDAYLDALALPPGEQLERRMVRWFEGSETYPRQLHEMAREDYLRLKRADFQRQQRPL